MTTGDDTPVPEYAGRIRLDGRRFLVLGAGQGIGRQTVHALAAVGARVACLDLEADRAHEIAREVGGLALVGDATKRPDMQAIVDGAVAGLGGLDGVVDIIGMARYAALTDVDDEEWDWHHDIVLRHAYLAVQLAGRVLAERGGVMVFVASVSGITSAPNHAAYGVAKAGLMSLVRSAAVELGPSHVRVNAVAPGVVWTPRVSQYLGDDGRERNEANTPLRRIAATADIAGPILFLCSDLSAFVTGQTLVVDGGVGAKFPYPMAGQ
ncbi:MAG TPA: SDR family oxidoreductase [Acidimicrobiia bacterium]|nr:SDR family oxidoreductase [Acidimicrobiia bacterium]